MSRVHVLYIYTIYILILFRNKFQSLLEKTLKTTATSNNVKGVHFCGASIQDDISISNMPRNIRILMWSRNQGKSWGSKG